MYEAAIRYNYTPVEKSALVDTISMIKTLCTLMLRDQAIIAPLLRCQVTRAPPPASPRCMGGVC